VMKRALITGCYGQDGSYLAELLAGKGYEIHGICKSELSENSRRIKKELTGEGVDVTEHTVSLYDYKEISSLIADIKPGFVFHMAAVHHSSEYSFGDRVLTEKELFDKNVLATSNILCACSTLNTGIHVVAAGSCLMFDDTDTDIQDEATAYRSGSMYGLAKIAEGSLVKYYRDNGLHVSQAILYNHESHRRSDSFVTKKIANGLKNIINGRQDVIELGDISVMKDWGFAGDYAEGMYLMAESDTPGDYVLATGVLHSIENYIRVCAKLYDINNYEKYLRTSATQISRKVGCKLRGRPLRAEKELGWKRKYSFEAMARDIVDGGLF